MNYQETLDYLFSQLPMFHRIGAAAYKADLKNTVALCELLDHPERKFRSVHIAGTNGKGSVTCMLAAILQEAGYKTGLFTSPHLKDFRERIRINGQMIAEDVVVQFVEKYQKNFSEIQPSFFEWTASLAFHHFANEKVEIAILETGMGGRLDSTNVVLPEVSVITNIGWDHMQFLGDTLEKIAIEKAGIIKENVPVIIGEVQEEVAHVFTNISADKHSTCVFAPLLWKVVEEKKDSDANGLILQVYHQGKLKYADLVMGLTGNYQKQNIIPVLQAISQLKEKGYRISEDNIRSGIQKVKELTGILGRWEVLNQKPFAVADTAHNKDGLSLVIEQIHRQKFRKLHIVLGLVNDKDVVSILKMFPKDATYYFCQANIPRALDGIELKNIAGSNALTGEVYLSVKEAYDAALLSAAPEDMVFVGGSTFVVAEVL
jgi:dihydrofolate synthase/folylpolyglutamate synthase